MKNNETTWGSILAIIILTVIIIAVAGWLTMFLWNSVLVAIFPNIPTISFWLAVGVWFIIRVLFIR